MAAAQFHNLTIKTIRPLTNSAVAIGFEIPDDLKGEFAFVPGQYLTLRATIDGEDLRRSYSICSADDDPILEVGIKHVEGGLFSGHAQTLKVGDAVQAMPPEGRFTAQIGGTNRYLLLAAGSGITPCLSIAKSVLAAEPESEITLIYGNRAVNSIMFLDDLIDLKDRYTKRLQIFHVLSREQSDIPFLNGRLNDQKIRSFCEHALIDVNSFDAAFLCGPQSMTESLTKTLKDLGIGAEQIRSELFFVAGQKAPPKRTSPKRGKSGAEVSIILDGAQSTVVVDGAESTVLAAAQKAGLDLPFSCAGGMCCTCRCKIVSGTAEMDVNYSLQDWEIEAGFTLACQTRPKTEKLVLDFDAT